MEENGCLSGFIIGFILAGWLGAYVVADYYSDYSRFKSPEPIIIDLEISVTNGVADTVYVYKRPM